MPDIQPTFYPELVGLPYRLPHLTESLRRHRKVKIVALGSSSAAGAEGIVPFPHRLEQALRTRFYGRMIDVINRGIGGQEAPEELSRFESDLIAEAPTLVIWQLGTNAVYHQVDYNYDDVQDAIAVGLEWLAPLPTDVILMDLQFTQAIVDINTKSFFDGHIGPGGTRMGFADDIEQRIAAVAGKAQVSVFQRWALMKRWRADGVSLYDMDDGSLLHTSEWATKWISLALDSAIGAAVGAVPGARRQSYDV
jgi:hypothetical protein